jgi:hypothetical protein
MDKPVRYGIGDPSYRSPKQSESAAIEDKMAEFLAKGGAVKVLPTTHRPAQAMPTAEHDLRVWRALNGGGVLRLNDNGLFMAVSMIKLSVGRLRKLGWPIHAVYEGCEVLVGWRRGWDQ